MRHNPVARLAAHRLWRHPSSFWLLFAYTAVLGAGFVQNYVAALRQLAPHTDPSSILGREVLLGFSVLQMLCLIFITPGLTATTIAAERERGLLEALQLSHLTPWQIVAGKLRAAVQAVLPYLLAAVPINSICFLLGGVTLAEFCMVQFLLALTALSGLIVGLVCSTWSRRAGTALRVAYAIMLGWNVGSLLAFFSAARGILALVGVTNSTVDISWKIILEYGYTSPLLACAAVLTGQGMPPAPIGQWFFSCLSMHNYYSSVALQLVGCSLFLAVAVFGLRRKMAEEYWTATRRAKTRGNGPLALRLPDALFWELPLARCFQFSNPILQHDVQARLRMRQVSRWVVVIESIMGVAVAGFYLAVVYIGLFEPTSRPMVWWVLEIVGLIVLLFAVVFMAATAFTRERESGSWEGVRLSLLRPGEIIAGKMGAILLICAFFSLPVWPLLLPCIRTGSDAAVGENGVTTRHALAVLLIMSAAVYGYGAWGLLVSWLARRSTVALGWTLGSMAAAFIAVPLLLIALGQDRLYRTMYYWHPMPALWSYAPNSTMQLAHAGAYALTMFGAGTFYLALLYFLVRASLRRGSAD